MEGNANASAVTVGATPLWKFIIVAAIAAGVQFGWAIQLSLLTPYVLILGIKPKYASYIWLCGPISGIIVQPVVGYYSDRSTSRFGKRRPFIVAGAVLVAIAVFLIGFAADIGHRLGDPLGAVSKPRAIAVFIVGFWILDVANNMVQGPCRALLADLSGGNHQKMRMANQMFSFFMAIGSILGFTAGQKNVYKMFPFSITKACNSGCANLKSCYFLSVTLLVTITVAASVTVREKVFVPEPGEDHDDSSGKMPFFGEMFGAVKGLSRAMWILLVVTCLNWIAWFPFLMFDTDWMGKDVYGGKPTGTEGQVRMYYLGVHAGALGLMINSIVLAFQSIANEPIARKIGGVKRLWGGVNFLLAICLALTVPITKLAKSSRAFGADGSPLKPDSAVKGSALALFAVLGIPFSVTSSIPFALASIYSSNAGAGQGVSLGLLNLAIVIPQMFVSVSSGPFDSWIGDTNLPSFVVGAIAAAASGIIAFTLLPTPPPEAEANLSLAAGGNH